MDIAYIVFVCTAVNHLGLIAAIEGIVRHSIPVINCPKCASFWSVLVYGIAATVPVASASGLLAALPRLIAISFLCSYLAI